MTRIFELSTGPRPKRRDIRVSDPALRLVIDDTVYEASDWSLGGFRTSATESYELGDDVRISHIVADDGTRLSVDVVGRIVRVDGEQDLAVRFVTVDDRGFRILERAMIRKRVSAPVDPAKSR